MQSRPWVQRLILTAAFATVIIHGSVTAFVRHQPFRDFDVQREVGRRFLTGEYLYAQDFCYPYMPIAAMYFSPLALFERETGLALRYTVAAACLWWTLSLLYRMVRERAEASRSQPLLLSVFTVLLAFQFLLQDLDDGGPNLILLAIIVTGIYSVWRGREGLGGAWFGLATALKVTPALFLPFFLWKRRWRLAGLTAVATLCWMLLPMVWMGSENWWNHQREWIQVSAGSFIGHKTEATIRNEERGNNQALRQALMRYLVTFPEDLMVRRGYPGYVPLLDLPPATAGTVFVIATTALLAILAWRSRRPYAASNGPAWLRECSAVMILALLLCPVTWNQHLVWLVPALYVVVLDARSEGGLGMLRTIALGIYALLVVILTHDVLGKQRFDVLMNYHPFTIAMLLLLAMVLFPRPSPEPGWLTSKSPAPA